jgi:hypothetical protein
LRIANFKIARDGIERAMSEQSPGARFRVTGHYEMTDRGGFVLGHIERAVIRPGTRVTTGSEPPTLTIHGVECIDNPAEQRYLNALVFAERPSLEFVQRVFPIGSMIEL